MTEYCPQCGAPLPENCLFCPGCGASCAQPGQTPPEPPVPGEAPPALDAGAPDAEAPSALSETPAPGPEEAPPPPPGETPPAPQAPAPGADAPPPGPRYAARPHRPAPAPGFVPPPAPDKSEMTTAGYLLCLVLFAIPVVGLVMMFIWGFGRDRNVHRRRLARAFLLFTVIMLALAILVGGMLAVLGAVVFGMLRHHPYEYYPEPYDDYFEFFLDDYYDDYYGDYYQNPFYYEDPYGYYGAGGHSSHHRGAVQ